MTTARATRRSGFSDAHPLVPYLYLLPHALLFLVFIVYPVCFGVWVSTHRWDPLVKNAPFIGLEFYAQLFRFDGPQAKFFWGALQNTLFFTAVTAPLLVLAALGLALLLHRPVPGRGLFRAIFFLPGILSVSVMGILWKWTFENQVGLINVVRSEYLNLGTIPFLTSTGWAWLPIVIGTVWWSLGFNMTLYLAALSNVPESLYEAAALDGAGGWAQFRFVTLPLLAPTTLFVAVTTILGSLQLFGQSVIITAGGPVQSTRSVIQYITEEAFTNYQMSSATAMAFVFGAILLVFTAVQFRIMAGSLRAGDRA